MVTHHQMSERHACALVGLSRDTYRNVGQASAFNVELRDRIIQTAHTRRRWGYRMIHDVLRPQYPGINHKRVYRIYTAEGLSIRKRKKTKRIGVRVPLVAALAVNQTWSMDFVSDAICRPGAVPRRIKCLTVADDFSHECVDITADFGIGGAYVTRLLDRILIEPGSPTQNAYIESFNGTFRDECLDENWFESLEQARQIIATWRTDYNESRPHSSCGRVPPATFAALNRQLTGDSKQSSKTDAGIS